MASVGWNVQFSKNFFENTSDAAKRNVVGESKLTGFYSESKDK